MLRSIKCVISEMMLVQGTSQMISFGISMHVGFACERVSFVVNRDGWGR